ncbi:MAG: CcoQ/FixQ family Cbb3-type cytochrome c oxidase assembly chaperone [Woeseiaceae bacterium]|nr:CcoQ/FixQ family Cbb3-type cytochrome c oxidase assembly chaperone [Woeseiaceae bacterium]
MDINDFRGLITGVLLVSFLGLWAWAWSSRRKADFDASAQLPLEEDNSMSSIEQENS